MSKLPEFSDVRAEGDSDLCAIAALHAHSMG